MSRFTKHLKCPDCGVEFVTEPRPELGWTPGMPWVHVCRHCGKHVLIGPDTPNIGKKPLSPRRIAVEKFLLGILGLMLLIGFIVYGVNQGTWAITVENRSDVPCSISVTYDINGKAAVSDVTDLPKGNTHQLGSGTGNTVVRAVQVVRGTEEQKLTPDAELPAGQRYAIVFGAGGKVDGSLSDK